MTVRSGADLETTYNIRSFASLDDALAQKPDAVFITNPNTLHLPIALAAADAGCHLLIEKPVSHSLDGLEALAQRVEQKHLVTFVAYQFRFHPGLKIIKNIIDDGRLGNLIGGHIVNGDYYPAGIPMRITGARIPPAKNSAAVFPHPDP